MSYVEDLLGAGALTQNELVELIKTLQYENNELRKENTLLKSKIVKAAESGYKF
jgi:flagellar biosynthesis protein FlhG